MRTLLMIITLLLTGPTLAEPALAAPLDDARAAHTQARADLTRIAAARRELADAHEQLAAEIEALKTVADNPLLPGVRDPRLDDRLKQARALAERLGGYDRDAADAEDRVEAARGALAELLDAELARQRAALAAAPPSERRARFEALAPLVDERQTLARRPGRSAPAPALPEPPEDALASPDELRELADETRDHAEQVRERLAMLQSRLGALRERQRLVRAAVAFQRDDALFVQDERNRRRGQREEGVAVATANDRPANRGNDDGGELGGGEGIVEAGDAAESPAAEPDDPSAAPPSSDADGAEGAFAGRDSDGDDFDSAAPPVDNLEVAPPSALPDLPSDIAGGSGPTLTIEETFDPSLLDELDGLSPDAIAQRIRAIERRQQTLEETRRALEARSGALEARARAMESE